MDLEHPAAHGLPTPSYWGNHSMLAIEAPKLRQQLSEVFRVNTNTSEQDKSIGFVEAKGKPFAFHLKLAAKQHKPGTLLSKADPSMLPFALAWLLG